MNFEKSSETPSWREGLTVPIVIGVVGLFGVSAVVLFWNDQPHAPLISGVLGFVASIAVAFLTWLYVSSNEFNLRIARDRNTPRIYVTDATWCAERRGPLDEQSVVAFNVTAVVTNRSGAVTTSVGIGEIRLDTTAKMIVGGRGDYFIVDGRNVSVLTLPPGESVELTIKGHQILTGLTESNFPTKAFIRLNDLVTEKAKEFEVTS